MRGPPSSSNSPHSIRSDKLLFLAKQNQYQFRFNSDLWSRLSFHIEILSDGWVWPSDASYSFSGKQPQRQRKRERQGVMGDGVGLREI